MSTSRTVEARAQDGTMTADPVAFAEARLAEEAAGSLGIDLLWGETAADNSIEERRARALREVEINRAILAEHAPDGPVPPACRVCKTSDESWRRDEHPCKTARLVLARWSDHPDYDGSWKPHAEPGRSA